MFGSTYRIEKKTELEVPPAVVQSVSQADPLNLHQIINASGDYSFKRCQINIKSQLNPDAWDSLLEGYWDTQLPLLIRFGFSSQLSQKLPPGRKGLFGGGEKL